MNEELKIKQPDISGAQFATKRKMEELKEKKEGSGPKTDSGLGQDGEPNEYTGDTKMDSSFSDLNDVKNSLPKDSGQKIEFPKISDEEAVDFDKEVKRRANERKNNQEEQTEKKEKKAWKNYIIEAAKELGIKGKQLIKGNPEYNELAAKLVIALANKKNVEGELGSSSFEYQAAEANYNRVKKEYENRKSKTDSPKDDLNKDDSAKGENKKSKLEKEIEELKIAMKATKDALKRTKDKNSKRAKSLRRRLQYEKEQLADLEKRSNEDERDSQEGDTIFVNSEGGATSKKFEQTDDRSDEDIFSEWRASVEKDTMKDGGSDEEIFKEWEDSKKEAYSNQEGEREVKQEEKEENLDEMQKEAEAAFDEYLKAEEKLQKIKNRRGVFNKVSRFLTSNDQKDGHINKEFVDAETELEEKKKKYRSKYQQFANKMVGDKKEEVLKRKDGEISLKNTLRSFIMSEKSVSRMGKDKDGVEQERKVSLLEYMNENEKRLLGAREAALSDQKKGNLSKLWEKYARSSKTTKTIISIGLSMTIGAGFMAWGGATLSAALGYGALKGANTLRRALTTGALTGMAVKGVAVKSAKTAEDLTQQAETKSKEDVVAELLKEDGNLFNALDDYNEECKKINFRKNAKVIGTAVLLGGTVLGANVLTDAYAAAESVSGGVDLDSLPNKPGSGETITTIKGGMIEGARDQQDLNKLPSKDHNEAVGDKSSRPGAGDRQSMYGNLRQENLDHYAQKAHTRGMYNELNNFSDKQESLLNHTFELEKGGNVWRSLEDHFGGDRREVGNVLAEFKKQTMTELVNEKGMSVDRAEQFMDWRYRHMAIGAGFDLKDGKLDIPGFTDEKMIGRFEKTEWNEAVGDDPRMNAGEHFKTRLNRNIIGNKGPVVVEESEYRLTPDERASIDKSIEDLKKNIYGRQAYEWDVIGKKGAWEIIKGNFGDPIHAEYEGPGSSKIIGVEAPEEPSVYSDGRDEHYLDGSEIKNRDEIREHLVRTLKETDIRPKLGESAEAYLRRVEELEIKKSHGFSGNELTDRSLPPERRPEHVPLEIEPHASNPQNEIPKDHELGLPPERPVNVSLENYQNALEVQYQREIPNWSNVKNQNVWDLMKNGSSKVKAEIMERINSQSRFIPDQDDTLGEFFRYADSADQYDLGNTGNQIDEDLARIFDNWGSKEINQWLDLREQNAKIFINRDLRTIVDRNEIELKKYLRELQSQFGEPNPNETVGEYVQRIGNSARRVILDNAA